MVLHLLYFLQIYIILSLQLTELIEHLVVLSLESIPFILNTLHQHSLLLQLSLQYLHSALHLD
jgi:hypothetical protein